MADQISRLIFDVLGRDRGGSKVLNDSAAASERAHLGMSKLGTTLSGLGGPFESIVNYAGQLGDSLDKTLARSQKLGLGLTATGVALTAVAARDQQAQKQLAQSIEDTGGAYSDYRGQIEEAIKQQENYAHTAHDTQEALNLLVTATQDPARAIAELGQVADIAAEKHESLAEAAVTLNQAQVGNLRALRQFGIVLDGVGTKSGQVDRALKQLAERLHGQAAASVDTFAGRLKVAETRLHDQIAAIGRYGPEITAVGAAITLASSALQVKAARSLADTAATAAETRAEAANAAARLATADAANVEAAAVQRAAAAQAEASLVARTGGVPLGVGGRLLRGGLIAGGGYLAATTVGTAVGGGAGRALGDIGGGAAIGAGIGSILPGPGTLVGAGVGAAVGGISYLIHHSHQASADKQAAEQAAEANKQLDAALNAQKAAAEKAANSLGGQIKALQESAAKTLGLSSAEDDLQSAMHNLAQSVHDGTDSLKGHSLAAEANRNALRDAVAKMLDLIQAQKDAGVSGEKVRASAIAMSQALEANAAQILGNKRAVDQFLQGLGALPPQIAEALGATSMLSEQIGEDIMHNLAVGIRNATPEVQQQVALSTSHIVSEAIRAEGLPAPTQTSQAAKDYGKHVAHHVVDGYAPAVSDGIDKATQDAMNREKQILDQVRTFYKGIRDQVVSGFNVAAIPQQTDIFGSPFGPADPAHAARQYVQQLEEWARLLGKLRKHGLNETMIDQLEQAGVAAIPVMREILKQHETRTLNRAERNIRRVGQHVAVVDTEHHFEHQLEQVMQRLPKRIAADLRDELKKIHIVVDLKDHAHHRGQRVRNKS